MVSVVALSALLGAEPSVCPSRDAVKARIAPLVRTEQRQSKDWDVERRGQQVRIVWLDAGGRVLLERWLAGPQPCAQLEQAAAVVVAAWLASGPKLETEAPVHALAGLPSAPRTEKPASAPAPPAPANLPRRRAPPASPGPEPAARAASPPSPAPVASTYSAPILAVADTPDSPLGRREGSPATSAPPAETTPTIVAEKEGAALPGAASPPVMAEDSHPEGANSMSSSLDSVPNVRPEPSPPSAVMAVHQNPRPFPVEFALDVRASWAGSMAPGVGLRFDAGETWGGILEISSSTERRAPLGNGFVHWQRSAVSLGARYRKHWGPWFIEPAVSAEAAILVMRGVGFKATSSALGFDASLCARVHGGVRAFDPLGVLIGIRGCAFPIDGRIGVAGVEATYPLPRGEVGVLIGFFWASTPVQGSSAPGP